MSRPWAVVESAVKWYLYSFGNSFLDSYIRLLNLVMFPDLVVSLLSLKKLASWEQTEP